MSDKKHKDYGTISAHLSGRPYRAFKKAFGKHRGRGSRFVAESVTLRMLESGMMDDLDQEETEDRKEKDES